MSRFQKHVFVCTNQRPAGHPRGCCFDKGSLEIRAAIVKGLADRGLKGIVRANKSGCLDACELGPTMVIYPQGVWYLRFSPKDVNEILDTSVVGNGVVARLVAGEEDWSELRRIRAAAPGKTQTLVSEGK